MFLKASTQSLKLFEIVAWDHDVFSLKPVLQGV